MKKITVTIPEPFTDEVAKEHEEFVEKYCGLTIDLIADLTAETNQSRYCMIESDTNEVDVIVKALVKKGDCDVRVTRTAD